MAMDFSKRINKQQVQLAHGEICEAAVVTKAKVGVGAAFGAVGVLAAAANQKRKAKKAGPVSQTTMATQVPAEQLLVGVTNQRLVFFTVTSVAAKAKDLAAAFSFGDVSAVDAEKSMAKWSWTITFLDGSSCVFETAKNQNNKGTLELLSQRVG